MTMFNEYIHAERVKETGSGLKNAPECFSEHTVFFPENTGKRKRIYLMDHFFRLSGIGHRRPVSDTCLLCAQHQAAQNDSMHESVLTVA